MIIKADDEISLELMDEHHAEEVVNLIISNRQHLSTWFPWVERMQHKENFLDFIDHCKKRTADGADYAYVVYWNKQLVGRIGIYYIDKYNRIGSIGYWIGQEYEGRGIMTKATNALISYGFKTLGLNRIEIKCGTKNYKSQGIPERLGFKKEGVLRQAEILNEEYQDLNLYSILKSEFSE
jgi:ribosomal-protein-serine acetyltransferase